MNKQKHIAKIIVVLLLTMVVYSCTPKNGTPRKVRIKHRSSKDLVSCLSKSAFKGDWLTSKAKAKLYYEEKKTSLRSNLRMRIDSATWISLSKASVPVMSTIISKDSVKFLNKVGKEYYLEEFIAINELLNTEIDYNLLQDFFLGNPIAFDYEGKYKVKVADSAYLISTRKSKKIEKLVRKGKIKNEPILYRCWIEPSNCKCKKVIINLLEQSTDLQVNYSDWEDVDGQLFPMYSSLKLTTPNDTILLEMKYSRVERNIPKSMPFRISKSYKPLKIDGSADE